ncbi:MAG: hypothetical protein OEN56_03925 [Gemmatimonadota bacterium]|nr:hypothetical protein [Gemmatimonadota bacterium]MDH3424017.1 hypothetical protein [Gemmatimonadota bacterium]
MGQSSRTRLLTAGLLFSVFGAGVLLGLAADSELGASTAEEVAENSDTTDPDEETPRAERRRLYHEVGPNESQLARIDSIVREHRARTNALDEELSAEYRTGARAILLDTREAIKSVLTAQQAAEYQRLLDEFDAERATERENGDERD